jgi:hypothetical protein
MSLKSCRRKVGWGVGTRLLTLLGATWLLPQLSHATQAHGAPEGLYSHQLAHLFFTLSLCWLAYWLQKRRLIVEPGWRYIQYGALFLILWNIDAFLAHFMDEQIALVSVQRLSNWQIQINSSTGQPDLAWIYYFLKLDHLLCVPALCFFYVGLKRLVRANLKPADHDNSRADAG